MAKPKVYCIRCGVVFEVWGMLVKTGFEGPVCKGCYEKERTRLKKKRDEIGKGKKVCGLCGGVGHNRIGCRSEKAVLRRIEMRKRAERLMGGRDLCWKYGDLRTTDPFLRALRKGEI